MINGNLYARSKLKISNISDTKKPSIKTKKYAILLCQKKHGCGQDCNKVPFKAYKHKT